MADMSLQRLNMVESQVRPSDITDRRILRAMREVQRENFAPAPLKSVAYMDEPLQVAPGRYLLAPRTFAKLVQLAEIDADDRVLDVGPANGYSTAVLAGLARAVVAVEADSVLSARAKEAMAQLGLANVKIVTGSLADGEPDEAPYDAIVINGAVPAVPAALLNQLKDGGHLVAIIADGPVGKAKVWQRTGRTFDGRTAFDAGAPLLPGFEIEHLFKF